jgi:hypothetical protein
MVRVRKLRGHRLLSPIRLQQERRQANRCRLFVCSMQSPQQSLLRRLCRDQQLAAIHTAVAGRTKPSLRPAQHHDESSKCTVMSYGVLFYPIVAKFGAIYLRRQTTHAVW